MRRTFMENLKVREYAKNHGVPLWRLAEELGFSENTIWRRMRKPLTAEEEKLYLQAIDQVCLKRNKI